MQRLRSRTRVRILSPVRAAAVQVGFQVVATPQDGYQSNEEIAIHHRPSSVSLQPIQPVQPRLLNAGHPANGYLISRAGSRSDAGPYVAVPGVIQVETGAADSVFIEVDAVDPTHQHEARATGLA
jgi:hypothetical protein